MEVNRHMDENRHVDCSPFGVLDPTARLDREKVDTPTRLTESTCNGLRLETERRTETPTSTPMATSAQGSSNLHGWKR